MMAMSPITFKRRVLLALFSAVSITIPGMWWVHGTTGVGELDARTKGIVALSAVGVLYAMSLMRTRGNGALIIAGASKTLMIVALLAIIPTCLSAGMTRAMTGDSIRTDDVSKVILYALSQFWIGRAAMGGRMSEQAKEENLYLVGLLLPVAYACLVYGLCEVIR